MSTAKGAVSGGHEAVVNAASEILRDGGNAVDAAIAAYFMACIAEPCMASLGAGMFCIYWPSSGRPLALDAFCQTPIVKRSRDEIDFFPVLVDFGDEKELFYAGMGAVAIPAVVSGLFDMHTRYGSIPMSELAEPAIAAAKEGVPLSDFQHQDLVLLDQIFRADPVLKSLYFPDGNLINAGTPAGNPDFADFLYDICRSSARDFYEGEWGQRFIRLSDEFGGHVTRDDLRSVHAIWEPAIATTYHGAEIFTPDSGSYGSWLIRYWFDYLNKHAEKGRSGEALLSAVWATSKMIKPGRAIFRNLKKNGTSHFNVMDKWGNGIAMTFSIGEGSGRVVPGTGVHMNNMLGEAALLPDGFHSWEENERMNSMMSPCALWHPERKTRMLLGSGGAGRIPFILAQVMQDWIAGDRHLNEIIMDPRCHFDGTTWQFEPGFDSQGDLKGSPVNRWESYSLYFGGVHALMDHSGHLEAMGDPRRDGVGYVIDTLP